MLFSAQTGGFYVPAIHGDAIPSDAVEITNELHAELLQAQSEGKVIVPGADGRPIADEPPGPSIDELWEKLRAERDRRLAASDIIVMPDRWEAYTPEQRAAWAAHRQKLRDLPENTTNPANPVWPAAPGA